MTVFWSENRIRNIEDCIERESIRRFEDTLGLSERISDLRMEMAQGRERPVAGGGTMTNTPATSTLVEMRLKALETGQPIDVFALIQTAIDILAVPIRAESSTGIIHSFGEQRNEIRTILSYAMTLKPESE